jgi:hypothetical protein
MMDELDNLKSAWKNFGNVSTGHAYSIDQLKAMVKKRSGNELVKIKRKIILEWSVAIILSVVMVMVIRYCNKADTLYAVILMALILGISVVPYVRIFRFKFHQIDDLRSYLTRFLNGYELLVTQYIKLSAVLMPLAGGGGLLLGVHCTSTPEEWHNLFTVINLGWFTVFLAVIGFIGHWAQKRYFNLIYGGNIKRLRLCLAELDPDEAQTE